MARPVGRPNLPYETRHVMLNIRTEYYIKMKREGTNMSKIVNDFLHDRFSYSVCPTCYKDSDLDLRECVKCDGRALFCFAIGCKAYRQPQLRECLKHAEPCTAQEFMEGKR